MIHVELTNYIINTFELILIKLTSIIKTEKRLNWIFIENTR